MRQNVTLPVWDAIFQHKKNDFVPCRVLLSTKNFASGKSGYKVNLPVTCNPVLTSTVYVQEKEKFRGLFMLKSLGSFGLKIALRYHCFVTGLREGEVKLVFYINLLRESLNIDINSISLCTLITSIMSLKAGKPAKSGVLADTVHCTVGPSRYVKFLSKPENQRSLSS